MTYATTGLELTERHGHLSAEKEAGLRRWERKTVEAVYVTTRETTNDREVSVKLTQVAAKLVLTAAEKREKKNQSASSILRRPAK